MNSTRSTSNAPRRETVAPYIPPHARHNSSVNKAGREAPNLSMFTHTERAISKTHQQIDRFFEARVPTFTLPVLDHSHFSSDSEDDDPLESHSPMQRSSRYTPFPASPTKNHHAPDVASWLEESAHDSTRFAEHGTDTVLALEEMDQPKLLQSISFPPTPCSSCGREPPGRPFVSLRPCDHLLCAECVNALVNAASNDPPRPADCFNCRAEITNFVGVDFVPLDMEAAVDEEAGMSGLDLFRTPEKVRSKKWMDDTPDSFAELSPYRKIDWATECATPVYSTPGTSPEFASSPKSTRPIHSAYSVVRVDNIRWNITVADVEAWIPPSVANISFEDQPLAIHILCNRADGKTLNQLYIELPTLRAAQTLVRLKNERPLVGRLVAVGLSSLEELIEHVFPAWDAGADGEELIAQEDLDGLLKLCRLEAAHASKAPERAFLNLATLLIKLPWHESQTLEKTASMRMFKTVEAAIGLLLQNRHKFVEDSEWRNVVEILVAAAMYCSAFRPTQKARLLAIPGLDKLELTSAIVPDLNLQEMTSPSSKSPAALRSPALDRVRFEHVTPSPPRFISQIPRTNLSPTPIRQSFVADLFTSPSPSTDSGALEVGGAAGGEAERLESISRELRVDLEMVKKISQRLAS